MMKIIYLIFFIGILTTIASANDKLILSSIEEAKALANQTKQPVLLIFGSDSCEYCKILKQDLNKGVLDKAIDQYIICYIDIKQNKEVKKTYNVSIIPDSRILYNNQQIEKIIGYSKEQYAKKLNSIIVP